ncbi:MAG: hypothetical protein Q9184_003145 [Pyrenodesmia sp. 2 TL-2023]
MDASKKGLFDIVDAQTAKFLLTTNGATFTPRPQEPWMRQIESRAEALIESSQSDNQEDTAKAQNLLENFYQVAVTALDAFLQSNVTGPPLPWKSAKLILSQEICENTSELRRTRQHLIQELGVDGEAVYKLIPNVELFALAKCLLNLPSFAKPDVPPRYRWARVTVNFWHQKLLGDTAASLQESIYRDLDALEDDLDHQNSEERARRLVQRATIHTQHGFDQKAREDLARATRETGFEFKLTGRLGKRTKFQEKDLSQLVVLAKSADSAKVDSTDRTEKMVHGPDKYTDGDGSAVSKPQNLDLDDDTLLESITFTRSIPETSEGKEPDMSPSLAALDPSNQPVLKPLDSIILLAYASSITNTSPADGLTREETLPYALRVLQDGSSNWQIYTQALLVRSRTEGYNSRTIERSVLQLQALVDQVIVETTQTIANDQSKPSVEENSTPSTFLPKPKPSESASASERLSYLHQLASPPRWDLEAELAARWVSLGSLRTALEIYERLQMWAEVALCWAANDREDRARRIIRRQLYRAPTRYEDSPEAEPSIDDNNDDTSIDELTIELDPLPPNAPRLFCILGDLEKSATAYERAWEVSNYRYARAQRSLGKHHFTRGNLKPADEAYSKSLKVNALNHATWFSLGCVRLQLEDWRGAVDAFGRAIQIEETDAESWSNMAAALVQLSSDTSVNGTVGDGEKTEEVDGDDNEDITMVNVPRPDPQKHVRDAFTALKRAAALKRDSYRIWQNLLNVSVKLSPPPYTDIIIAQTRLIDLRSKTEGEGCIDIEVMEGLVAHLIATTPSPPPAAAEASANSEEETTPSKTGFNRILTSLIFHKITPLITSSRRLWLLTAKLSLHLQKPLAALQAYEKAWRVTLNAPGWESGTKEAERLWMEVVEATGELVDAYENLGERGREWGMGEGEMVARDWRFKARASLRSVLGRGKEGWEGSGGFEALERKLRELKSG